MCAKIYFGSFENGLGSLVGIPLFTSINFTVGKEESKRGPIRMNVMSFSSVSTRISRLLSPETRLHFFDFSMASVMDLLSGGTFGDLS